MWLEVSGEPPAHPRQARRARRRSRSPPRPPAPCRRSTSATTSPPRRSTEPTWRALVDLDPGVADPVAQAAGEPRRLHGRRPRVEGAAAEDRRGAARGEPRRRRAVTQASGSPSSRQALGDRLPGVVPGGRGRDLEVAGRAIPGVDLLLATELADLVDRVAARRGRPRSRARRRSAAQRRQAEPERVDEAAVAPARALAAALGLEQRRRAPPARAASGARPSTARCSRRRRRRRRRCARPRAAARGCGGPGLVEPVAVRVVPIDHRPAVPRDRRLDRGRLDRGARRCALDVALDQLAAGRMRGSPSGRRRVQLPSAPSSQELVLSARRAVEHVEELGADLVVEIGVTSSTRL